MGSLLRESQDHVGIAAAQKDRYKIVVELIGVSKKSLRKYLVLTEAHTFFNAKE